MDPLALRLSPLEVFDKEIRCPIFFSSYVRKVFQEAQLILKIIRRFQELKLTGLAPLFLTFFSLMIGTSFQRFPPKEINEIKYFLKKFSEASGQTINQEKSKVIFSQNTPRKFKRVALGLLKIKQSQDDGKYLGLPSSIGRNKISLFSYIEERARLRIQG